MVRVTGDVVRQAQAAFLTSFHGHGAPLLPTVVVLPGAGRPRLDARRARAGDPRRARGRLAGDPGADRRRSRAPRCDEPLSHRPGHDRPDHAAARRGVQVRVVVSKIQQRAARRAEAPLRGMLDAGRLWDCGHGRPREVSRRRRCQLRHRESRRLGAYRNSEIMMIARSASRRLIEERLFEPDIARSSPASRPQGRMSASRVGSGTSSTPPLSRNPAELSDRRTICRG